MSKIDVLKKKIIGLLTCGVCKYELVEPYSLSECNHTFCQTCILECVDKNNDDDDSYIVCPVCRVESYLPLNNKFPISPLNSIIEIVAVDYENTKQEYFENKKNTLLIKKYKKSKEYKILRKKLLHSFHEGSGIISYSFVMSKHKSPVPILYILSTTLWDEFVCVNDCLVHANPGSIGRFIETNELTADQNTYLMHEYLDVPDIIIRGEVENMSPLYSKIYMYPEKHQKELIEYIETYFENNKESDIESNSEQDSEQDSGRDSEQESEYESESESNSESDYSYKESIDDTEFSYEILHDMLDETLSCISMPEHIRLILTNIKKIWDVGAIYKNIYVMDPVYIVENMNSIIKLVDAFCDAVYPNHVYQYADIVNKLEFFISVYCDEDYYEFLTPLD